MNKYIEKKIVIYVLCIYIKLIQIVTMDIYNYYYFDFIFKYFYFLFCIIHVSLFFFFFFNYKTYNFFFFLKIFQKKIKIFKKNKYFILY